MLTEPQLIDTAAENVAEVRSAIGAAKAAAAGPTTRVAAAAADEVSAAAAKLFGSYAREYQAVLNQAATFHDDFAAALTSAANAYAAAEAANASAISGALGGTGGTATPMVVQPSLQGTTIGLIMGGAASRYPHRPPLPRRSQLFEPNLHGASLGCSWPGYAREPLSAHRCQELDPRRFGGTGRADSRQRDQKHARHQCL